MESISLCRLPQRATRDFVKAGRRGLASLAQVTTFSGLPTAMLFAPSEELPGSVHCMVFPTPARQRMHYHPGDRNVLLIGDVEVFVQHSLAERSDNPLLDARELRLPPFELHALRFPAFRWHRFETREELGTGVLAFSFHGDDALDDSEAVHTGLMEELTFFWEGDD